MFFFISITGKHVKEVQEDLPKKFEPWGARNKRKGLGQSAPNIDEDRTSPDGFDQHFMRLGVRNAVGTSRKWSDSSPWSCP